MREFNETTITQAVIEQFNAQDPRLQSILASLVTHLHDFIREVEPTEEEWFKGIMFLTQVGQMCDDNRQEFILLSDTLGVSILVDAVNHRVGEGTTETTVLGPFHTDHAKPMELGAQIASTTELAKGQPTVVHGQITDPSGQPIAGAKVDVWQASSEGFYDVQMGHGESDLRGIFITDAEGKFWFKSIKPVAYPIPHDGPVGKMLRATGRHPYRPAHIHYMISAEGYETLITHVFVSGDEYLDSDAVFAVKNSLVADFIENNDPQAAASLGYSAPFYELTFNFGLKPQAQ
ncbi:MAG: intradiol ring-cleavage dioxygenase [Phototrophicaceae bacterium]